MEDNKLDFERLTAQQIYDYMMVNATDEQKKDFKETAFPTRIKKTSKKLFTADGQPILYQVKDKNGNPKLKDGKPVTRQKIEMVEVADGEKKPTFSLLAAKWWFAENFSDAVKNVPVRASKKETPASLSKTSLFIINNIVLFAFIFLIFFNFKRCILIKCVF